ncbi:glycosyltransferase [Citrus sinensis]|uniref:Glycosyltransferase n=1 Tax=Citrus sinensis TaxID=2711 RepID=A0ACB8ISS2_CITSI|nr:glycosyltransferase [Citrus sinensis]
METKHHNRKPSILMLPWLAHGHITPYLALAKKLSQQNFHIYFCSTSINLQSISQNLGENFSASIQLTDLQLPCTFPELHDPYNHTTKNIPRCLIPTLIAAFDAAKPAFCNVLETLKPTLVIYDLFQPWAAEAAYQHDIAAVAFLTTAAASFSFFLHNSSLKFPFPEFDLPESEIQKMTQFKHRIVNGTENKDRFLKAIDLSCKLVLIKTSREIESKYLDYFSYITKKETIPVGPLVQEPVYTDNNDDTKIMDWLSRKEPSSVVYVSFGSEYFLSQEEMNEIASGLLLSEVSFIWVVRFHSEGKFSIEEALPQSFSKEIHGNNKGMVVQGGFVSHCGWGSTVEGIMYGVPIIAVPMVLDQLFNAKMVADIGVGLEVPREEINQRVRKKDLARVIKQVVEQEEGQQIKRKAKELSESIKKKGDDEEINVVEKLLQLVKAPS